MLKECESEVLNKEGYVISLVTEVNQDDETVYFIKIEDRYLDTIHSTSIINKNLAIELYDAIKKSCKYNMLSNIGFNTLINSILMRRKKL